MWASQSRLCSFTIKLTAPPLSSGPVGLSLIWPAGTSPNLGGGRVWSAEDSLIENHAGLDLKQETFSVKIFWAKINKKKKWKRVKQAIICNRKNYWFSFLIHRLNYPSRKVANASLNRFIGSGREKNVLFNFNAIGFFFYVRCRNSTDEQKAFLFRGGKFFEDHGYFGSQGKTV